MCHWVVRFWSQAPKCLLSEAQVFVPSPQINGSRALSVPLATVADRLEREDLPLTHDFLSMMLGVRRPGVTIAVQNLEGNRLIRAKRGHITVLDRTGLEGVADSAYGASEAEYASVMGQA